MSGERITTMTANGGPPPAAASLYAGEVMHQRLRPFGHRFAYRVFSLVVDLDRLGEADALSRFFSVNGRNLVAFNEDDHAFAEGQSLRAMADRLFAESGLAERPARILLMCYPRVFGYVFNPISVYFAYDAEDRLVGLAYSVRNTFGERHLYVAPAEPGQMTDAGVRQERQKTLHVSPFIGMDARYHFRVLPPGRTIKLRIHETEAGEPLLAATFAGNGERLDDGSLLRNLARLPLMTFKVMAAIHWQALKIWMKGATFHKSPPPPEAVSFHDRASVLQPGE
jgi:uncharacterized protein